MKVLYFHGLSLISPLRRQLFFVVNAKVNPFHHEKLEKLPISYYYKCLVYGIIRTVGGIGFGRKRHYSKEFRGIQ